MLNMEKAHRVDHFVVNDFFKSNWYTVLFTIHHTQCYSIKGEMECVFNILFQQMFKHGKGKLITCIAQTLIQRVINAIVDPTKVHFGEWCSIHPTSSLLQMKDLANWWITMVVCFFHDRFHQGPPWLSICITTIFAKSAKLRVAWAPAHLWGGSKK